MNSFIISKLEILQKRYQEIEIIFNNFESIKDKNKFCALSKEFAQLTDIVTCFQHWKKIKKEISVVKNMLDDIEIRDIVQDELKKFSIDLSVTEKKLKFLLLPKDYHHKYGCFFEIHAGTGGHEASLFAGSLFRMYNRYIESKCWTSEIIHVNYSEYGGYKEIIFKIPHKGAYSQLQFESGCHRVQRIPNTESQGRIHTSTCMVAVIPETPEKKLPIINNNDLRIDTFRSSGAGGQHVNTTESAIRIIHIPTGITVECQDERSQHKNKNKALSILRTRLYADNIKNIQEKESSIRRTLLGTGDRSNRIRTYNFQHGRITDHRIGLTLFCLDKIMEGDIDLLIKPLIQKDRVHQLTALSKGL